MILAPLQKMPKTVGDLGKLIVAKGFKKSPKVQKIAKSGHTVSDVGKSGYEMPRMNDLPICFGTANVLLCV